LIYEVTIVINSEQVPAWNTWFGWNRTFCVWSVYVQEHWSHGKN